MRDYAVGHVLGVPLYVEPSLVLISVPLGLWTASAGRHAGVWPTPVSAAIFGLLGALIYCASILLHELGHLVALKNQGISVESLTLSAWGGRTRTLGAEPDPGADAAVAAAGPAVTLLLTAAGFALFAVLGSHASLRQAALLLAIMNLALLPGSVIPVWPSDSSRIARALSWKATGDPRLAMRIAGMLGLMIILVLAELGALLLIYPSAMGQQTIGLLLLISAVVFLPQARASIRLLRQAKELIVR